MNIALVHGLWNRGWAMASLAKRLRADGHHVIVFSYPSRSQSLEGHAQKLHAFLTQEQAQELHLVGHSMGGLVILKMLDEYDDLPPGRVVLMGTPVKGSAVVSRLQVLPFQQYIFGKVRQDLLEGFEFSPAEREVGVICGTRAFGLGRIAGDHDEPNDGTVTISETGLEGVKDSIELDVAHSEMLVSAEVARQAEQFLLNGRFDRNT